MYIVFAKTSFNEFSFTKVNDENLVSTYYTIPAKATPSSDTPAILHFIEDTLEKDENQQWKWVIDATGFTLEHAMELHTAKALCQLFDTKYKSRLIQMTIIHPTWHIHTLFYLLWPFIPAFIRSIIIIQSNYADDNIIETVITQYSDE
jgi:hypothetical protein